MISIIAALGKNRELGKDNKLLWYIPADMNRFKKLTSGQIVIMGRKTYDSLPEKFRPLPNRVNIVVTRNKDVTKNLINNIATTINQLIVVNSIEEAIDIAKQKTSAVEEQSGKTAEVKEIYIIGGAQIYNLGIKYADKLYLTLVDREYPDADAFFPEYGEFNKIVSEESGIEGDLKYKFIDLIK